MEKLFIVISACPVFVTCMDRWTYTPTAHDPKSIEVGVIRYVDAFAAVMRVEIQNAALTAKAKARATLNFSKNASTFPDLRGLAWPDIPPKVPRIMK
jgi:hypothetical protein